jgi:ribosomal protein S18 acetylase RimI-like enzyme
MAVDLLELNEDIEIASDLVIEHVGNVDVLQQMIQAFSLGYEIPGSVGELIFDMLSDLGFEMPLRQYVGYLRGKPVACSSLFFSAGVAGIYLVATVPEARGQGIGSALTLIPLLEARDMGYRIGVLGSSEMGLGVYQRLGFQEYFKFGHYIYGG